MNLKLNIDFIREIDYSLIERIFIDVLNDPFKNKTLRANTIKEVWYNKNLSMKFL